MIKSLFLIFVLALTVQAEMPSVYGKIYCNDESFRDVRYDYCIARQAECIKENRVTRYTLSGGTFTHYALEVFMQFSEIKRAKRDEIENKIVNTITDPRCHYSYIKIVASDNDGIPGKCTGSVVERVIEKGIP